MGQTDNISGYCCVEAWNMFHITRPHSECYSPYLLRKEEKINTNISVSVVPVSLCGEDNLLYKWRGEELQQGSFERTLSWETRMQNQRINDPKRRSLVIYGDWSHYETFTNVYYIAITMGFPGDANLTDTAPSSLTTSSGMSICCIGALSGLAPSPKAGSFWWQWVTFYCKNLFMFTFRLWFFMGNIFLSLMKLIL